MRYFSISQMSEKWGISQRRIRTLCAEGRIEGPLKLDHIGRYQRMQKSRKMKESSLVGI